MIFIFKNLVKMINFWITSNIIYHKKADDSYFAKKKTMYFSHLPFGFNLKKGSTNLHFHYVFFVLSAAVGPVNMGLNSQVSSVELRPLSGFFYA